MTNPSELDTLKAVDDALSGLPDGPARDRVLRWAWEKYSSKPVPTVQEGLDSGTPNTKKKTAKKTAAMKKGHTKGKVKSTPSIVKDLNLKPKGEEPFDAFAGDKKPASNHEKCAVSVYYLRQKLGLSQVSADHVYTCFKHMKWRVPANLPNALQVTASVRGWLDTSNMEDIKVTTIGENLIEHDLPRPPKGTRKS
jgi:hypothetical protein